MSQPGKPPAKPKPPTSGHFAAPPVGAPHQTTAPLDPETVQAMVDKARANERPLKDLVFETPKPQAGILLVGTAQPPASVTVSQTAQAELVPGSAEPLPATAAQPTELGVGEVQETMQGLADEFNAQVPGKSEGNTGPSEGKAEIRRPAESDTDTPSRGIPKAGGDPGKQVTGGWGPDGGEGQYFALDGQELAKLVDLLLKDVRQQLEGDLRFGIAVVYPQVRAQVLVQIDGIDPSVPVSEQKFELGATRIVDLASLAEDSEATPADALRDEMGVPRPRKQLVTSGAGQIMVDVPHALATR